MSRLYHQEQEAMVERYQLNRSQESTFEDAFAALNIQALGPWRMPFGPNLLGLLECSPGFSSPANNEFTYNPSYGSVIRLQYAYTSQPLPQNSSRALIYMSEKA
jgi:hypothetical protein